ncbi:hypothetical protein [Flavobacterium sp. H4147]|uniref:hypothetical protein n=1 Tax=Flavobacterium sp. H4147 TaxID=3034149 RepID=UPI0023ECA892|nr:hypothetical protein [Flavobacterium sp. H4147]
MKNICTLIILAISLTSFSQKKIEYLKQNRFDLSLDDFRFPDVDFNIVGYGAYHGSAKNIRCRVKFD